MFPFGYLHITGAIIVRKATEQRNGSTFEFILGVTTKLTMLQIDGV